MNKQGNLEHQLFIGLLLAMIFVGILVVASSSAPFSAVKTGHWDFLLAKHMVHAGLGLIVFVLISLCSLKIVEHSLAFVLFGFSLLLLLATVVKGQTYGGSGRWLDVGVLIQPSEFVKLTLIAYVARYCSLATWDSFAEWKGAIIAFIPLLLVVGLLLIQPDLSTSIQISIVIITMLFIAGLRLKHLVFSIGSLAITAFVAILTNPYQYNRILAFLNPADNSDGLSYQVTRALIAIGRGGFNGMGYGNSFDKNLYLPEAHNDFVFAIFVEETGFLGALLLLLMYSALFVWLVWQGSIAIFQKKFFNGYLCLGIMIMLFVQVCMHVAVSISYLPPTGVNLPFISTGGSNLIATAAMMGLAYRVCIENNNAARLSI